MLTVPIEKIQIGERQRKSLGEIDDLVESIDRVGLIHPIVVDESYNLLAGERRLSACKMLKWNEVPIRQFNELNDIEKKEIELEENIRRKNLEWQEEVKAKLELDKIKRSLYGDSHPGQIATSGWRLKDTADSLGESIGNVSMDIQVAKAIEKFPQLANAKSKTRAYSQYKQLIDHAVRRIIAEESPQEFNSEGLYGCSLYNSDCLDKVKELPDESVDLIITDPPFGVDLDTNPVGDNYIEVYEDSFNLWSETMAVLLPQLYRVLTEGGHMYIFFTHQNYRALSIHLESSKFEFDRTPCIWYKGYMRAYPASPMRRFRYNYEPFFFCWKGKQRLLTKDYCCVFDVPGIVGQEKVHIAEKPEGIGQLLAELSSIEGEVVLDPFAGSGSLIYPAYKMKRRVIGIEKSENFYNMLLERFHESINNNH